MTALPRPRRIRCDIAWAAGLVAVVGLTGCGASESPTMTATTAALDSTTAVTRPTTPTAAPTTTTTAPATSAAAAAGPGSGGSGDAVAALALLDTLAVKGRAPKTGYERDLFGQAWSDDVSVAGGHNGCDTRNDILRRDLIEVELKPGTRGCVVLTGVLPDRYTATTIPFTRGSDTSSAVQIDHVVALSDAWQKGAQQLDAPTLRNLANDPRNLQAVDGPTNQRKGDGDAATWLPPNREYRCTYVARQIEVKAAYGLWVTTAERDAMARVLADCGAAQPQVAPAAAAGGDDRPPVAPAPAPAAPAPVPLVGAAPAPARPDAGATVSYANCGEVRAAGAAPIRVGEPGYSGRLDRDGDGIACE
ncbi:DUF1524 domain-containing protein [Rhodococcus sp. NPDC058505]|uniref:GmrSD restriction endonuclease domain-containing protein n=1 Tax=Rhodococcus sp. NPDC058505 TaxID=3346531 RepID=UPI00365DCC5C